MKKIIWAYIALIVTLLAFETSAVSLPPNATIAWEMEEASGSFIDYYNNYNLTVTGGAFSYQRDTFGNLSYGANSTTTGTFGLSNFTGIQTGDFTEEVWFKPENTNDQILVVSDNGNFGGFRLNSGGVGKVELFIDGTYTVKNISTAYTNISQVHQYIVTRSGNTYITYVDGVFCNTSTYAGNYDRGNLRIGFTGLSAIGTYYAIRIWDGTALNAANVTQLYNNGKGLTFPFSDGGGGGFTPQINFTSPTPDNQTNNYYEEAFKINTSASYFGGTVTASHYIYNSSGALLYQINGSANLTSNYTISTPGTYFYNATATNSSTNLSTATRQINITYWNAFLNLTLKNILNASIVTNATINITDLNSSWFQQYNTTTGNINALIAKNHTLFITLDAQGYAFANYTYQSNTTTQQYLNISLYTNNSLDIRIYDESTGAVIAQNITIVISNGSNETTQNALNGSYYIDNLADGVYTVRFSGANYTLKSYTVTVAARSYQLLNAYLSTSTQTVIMTAQDFNSGASISGVTMTQSRLVNGSWTIIDTRYSDITGRVQFSYIAGGNYRFSASKTGYTSETFNLNPVLFASYTVNLHRIITLTNATNPPGLGVSVLYIPGVYNNLVNNSVNFIITSPTGTLTTYRLNVTYPGGAPYLNNGANAYGATFSTVIFINATTPGSKVNISYCYDTTLSLEKCFKFNYEIRGIGANHTTMASNIDRTYGLGMFERVLIVTIIITMVGGLAFFFGGIIAGLPLSLFLLGFFYYTGFLNNVWLIAPSVLIGLFVLMGRQD